MREVLLTLREACEVLDPPLSEQQLRDIIRALHWQPAGWHHTGNGRGHPHATYPASEILRLHAALVPFMH